MPHLHRVVSYPIVGNDKGGRLSVFKKLDAPNIVFFCAWYTYVHGSFSVLVKLLAQEANCLCDMAYLIAYDGYKLWTSYRSQC